MQSSEKRSGQESCMDVSSEYGVFKAKELVRMTLEESKVKTKEGLRTMPWAHQHLNKEKPKN